MGIKKSAQIDVMLVAGTRPEVIKLSQLQKKLDFCRHTYVYTGQHFSENMKDIFFDELESRADVDLSCNTSDVNYVRKKLVDLIKKTQPLLVLVYGDTNSTLAAALAAKDTKTQLVHIEAGLRSFDLRMPEERNRIKVDHLSDYLLCPTRLSKEYLRLEGIKKNVFVTGNLIVDVCRKFSDTKFSDSDKFKDNILLTLHRAENVDDVNSLKLLVGKLREISDHKVIFPIHPRTKKNLKVNKIKIPQNVTTIDPVGYLDFLEMIKNSKLILTDSGGVQEESIILKKPCITLRYTTERWETILMGGNRLYPLLQNNQNLADVVEEMLRVKIQRQPYGEFVTRKTVNAIKKILKECKSSKLDNTIKIPSR